MLPKRLLLGTAVNPANLKTFAVSLEGAFGKAGGSDVADRLAKTFRVGFF